MKPYLAWVLVTMGLLGCGAQQLQPTGGSPNDAGCPPMGKMSCPPLGCSDVSGTPECVDGVWSCPVLPIDGLICHDDGSATGPSDGPPRCPTDGNLPGCAPDAGAGSTADGSTGCPSLLVDGGRLACGCGGTDTTRPPTCVGGTLVCPAGSPGLQTCSLCANQPLPPPGCRCNFANGALICARDSGADAPS
jgi:hypothetical protein